jgi:hypothetical protein
MYPPQYESWFISEDESSQSTQDLHHKTLIRPHNVPHVSVTTHSDPASRYSCCPDLDFQVSLPLDDQYDTYNSLNSLHSAFSAPGSPEASSSPTTIAHCNIELELKLNTPDSLLWIYNANILEIDISPQHRWIMRCPECSEWCQSGISASVPLWSPGQFRSLSNHRGSKKCVQAVHKQQKLPAGENTCDGPISWSLNIILNQRYVMSYQLIN